ncbi:MAG: DNA repair protein RecN [Firmicutes bacterium]|nr:DNA repair protein RecN [Bacillota bacterium]
MLSLLHIENIAVIESADISFDQGFTVLTGETGAGKSIVIDAISAILGERAYRDMIRTGAGKAAVRAVFTDVPELSWFAENGVEYDSETVVQREIYLDGKNVCRVNGSLVTVSILRKLGIQLINIHGQHDSASLFDEANHLSFLDAFADNQALRADYGEKYEAVAKLRREIDRLTMDEGEKLRRMETLKYQIAEIEKAELEPGEDTQLEERRKILQNAEKLSNGMETAVECLYGGEDTDGAAGLLAQAEYALARLSRFSDSFSALHDRVSDLMYQVQDAAEEVRDARDNLSYSADELEQIESRLDVIHKLRRKYGADCEEILTYLEKARNELDDMEFADDHLERLKGKLQKAEKAAWDAAFALRENRKAAAEAMSKRILSELTQLDMPRVQFSCVFQEQELSPTGADAVAFYMSANAGEALKPMSKVASGGELARIMLAMKNVLAEKDRVSTLIFDEVDTGVSGRAAQKVAEKLRSVAAHKQVLCVTHLPQLAALADHHLLISKSERGGRTYTAVTPLDWEGRKRELARIIGGTVITETTLKSAEEMLCGSEIEKRNQL